MTFESLGLLAGAGSSGPTDVSGDGTVVVGSGVLDAEGLTVAIRWTSSGIQNLGTPSDCDSSQAMAMSGDGSVVVGDSSVGGSVGRVRRRPRHRRRHHEHELAALRRLLG